MKRMMIVSSLPTADILAMNGAPVTNPEALRDRVGKSKGTVAHLVKREEAQIYIPTELS